MLTVIKLEALETDTIKCINLSLPQHPEIEELREPEQEVCSPFCKICTCVIFYFYLRCCSTSSNTKSRKGGKSGTTTKTQTRPKTARWSSFRRWKQLVQCYTELQIINDCTFVVFLIHYIKLNWIYIYRILSMIGLKATKWIEKTL